MDARDPRWKNFTIAGRVAFDDLLNEEITPAILVQGSDYRLGTPAKSKKPVPPTIKNPAAPATEFSGWANDPHNDHDPTDAKAYYEAFVRHCEENDRVAEGTYGIQRAVAGGLPVSMLPHKVKQDHETFTAQSLGVPVFRIRSIHHVESAGNPFGAPGRALVRFEMHKWLENLAPEKLKWAGENFKVDMGLEWVMRDNGWVSMQAGNQETALE